MTQGPPQFLQHFRLDKLLAQGGMGAVYLGYDTSLERPVAVKLILPEYAKQQGFTDRFLREARAQAQIAHSNVVQVYFVGIAGETLFMAMEFVDGGDLSSLVEKQGKLKWQDALRHMLGLAEGLREANRLNIIHRDIKPQNILLDRFGLAHLADFGLAAPVTSSAQQSLVPLDANAPTMPGLPKLTMLGAVMGTPAYMAPEQAMGLVLDQRADIYALGATFYELLSGRSPTSANTLAALAQFHAGPPPPKLREIEPSIPAAFADLIDKAMARKAGDRFANYDELIEALRAAEPKPKIAGASVVRVLAWLIDVLVFAAVTRLSLKTFPLAGFLALLVWWLGGAALLGSSPGQWMMRLGLRDAVDGRLPLVRLPLRFLAQHAWLAFTALFIASVYESSSLSGVWLGGAALLGLIGVGGSLLAFSNSERRTLVDRLSAARVLVDVR